MDPIAIEPTSRDSAVCEPIVLRQSDTVRLVFKPELVNSVHDGRHAVKGTFAYQRKRKADEWEDASTLPLSRLKAGEGVRLEVRTEEVFKLVTAVEMLYEAHRAGGVPKGKSVALLSGDGDALQRVSAEDLEKILAWAVESGDTAQVVEQLGRLGVDGLQKLNTLVGISSLKSALSRVQ